MPSGTLSRRRFDDLKDKVSRFDSVTSGITTAITALVMIALGFAGLWLTHLDFSKQVKLVQAEMIDAPSDEPEGKFGANIEAGDLPEELPNREQEVMTDPSAAPDIAQELEQIIQQQDFTDPNQTVRRATGGTVGGAAGLGTKGTGTGAGGVNRAQRWFIDYGNESEVEYARKLDFFNVEIAVIRPGQINYVSGFSTGTKVAPGTQNENIHFQWSDRPRKEADRKLISKAVNATGAILAQRISKELEAQMLALELGFQKKKENEIRKTTFGIRPSGAGFAFYVVSQQLLN